MMRKLGVLSILLAACTAAGHGQAAQKRAKPTHAAHAKQSEEQALIEVLNDKYDRLASQMDQMQQRLSARETELQQAKDDAAAARKEAAQADARAERAEEALGTNNQQVAGLQSAVTELKTTSATLSTSMAKTRTIVKAVEEPEAIHYRGIGLHPGGFTAAETVWRRRGIGGDINTQFSGVPFSGSGAGKLSEFNATGRQSRLTLLAEGKVGSDTMRAYYEGDFLSAGTTSNDNQSNSYTLRQRQVWAQTELHSGWTFTGGQMWSLATENKSGLRNAGEFIPLTIDAQYNAGFTWERQYGFRVVRNFGNRIWAAASAEAAETLNIGGHNLPPLVYQQAGNSGGLYNPTANYSYNRAPDLVAKIVMEPGFGHYEIFGIGRFFRDEIYPDVCWNTASVSQVTQTPCSGYKSFPTLVSANGVYTSKTDGGGVGANAWITLPGHLDVAAHLLVGDGVGRYGSSTLSDVTASPDGSLEPLKAASALGRLEWHPTPRWDIYAYYGGDYVAREYYLNPAGTLTGYGIPTNVTSGCNTLVPPTTSANGGGSVPGSAASCTVDNRNIQEGTFGYWYRFYRGNRGTLQQGFQYSYVVRNTWIGVGGAPKAIDNMWFTSFRYYLPQ